MRAHALGADDVELRDRDGGYARSTDGGAAVALIGRAEPAPAGDDDVDLLVLALPGGADERVELAGTAPAEVVQASTVIALAPDVVSDAKLVADAKKLARLLGAKLVGEKKVRAFAPDAIIDRSTPLAPELCVTIGNTQVDLAGASSLVRIGAPPGKTADGAITGLADVGLAELLKRLEQA
jgi:hypothetical protein